MANRILKRVDQLLVLYGFLVLCGISMLLEFTLCWTVRLIIESFDSTVYNWKQLWRVGFYVLETADDLNPKHGPKFVKRLINFASLS